MRVSSDLIFLDKDKKVVIYNYFINRAIMVNKDSAHFIKYNMGKCIETNMIVDENLKILKKNGVIIENEKEYKEKEYKIKDINVNINTVYFHVTQRCNLNCTYCYNKKNLNLSKELDTKNIIKILNKLKKINVEVVNFTGGEPLLRNDIEEILKEAKKLKFNVCLLTNGTLLNKHISILGVIDKCIVSIDNIDNKENSLTRKGIDGYDVLSTIEQLPEKYKEKICVRSVVTKGNENIIERNRKYFDKLKIKYIVSTCLPNNKDEVKNMPRLDNNLIDGNKPSMCGAGKRIIAIDSNGDIYPCQTFVRTIYKFGNILDDNWYEEFLCNIMDKKNSFKSIMHKERCKKCKYKYICLGGCPNLAYRVYNDVNHSNDFMCKIYKENAKKFLLSLFEGKDNV